MPAEQDEHAKRLHETIERIVKGAEKSPPGAPPPKPMSPNEFVQRRMRDMDKDAGKK